MNVAEMLDVKVGDRVRSYDFDSGNPLNKYYIPGRPACYVVGRVVEIVKHPHGYPAYRIAVERRVWDGVLDRNPHPADREAFPPVNGVPRVMGGPCNGVHKIADDEEVD
jgi:hypothetical protein